MLLKHDETKRVREFELSENDVLEAIEKTTRRVLELPDTARVDIQFDIGSSGIFRGATVTVQEKA